MGTWELGEGCEDWETPELGEDEEAPQWQLTSLGGSRRLCPVLKPMETKNNPVGSLVPTKAGLWLRGPTARMWCCSATSKACGGIEESPTPTLRCDPTTPGTIYTLQGTGVGKQRRGLGRVLTGQVARLENNQWTVETLPVPLTSPVLALALDGTRIAAQTLEGCGDSASNRLGSR